MTWIGRLPRGFTLIELLVAMAIFGVISALALGGLNTVITQQTLAKAELVRLGKLQRAMRYLTSDFSQLSPRNVRDELGRGSLAPLLTDPSGEVLVQLSRGGWRNPAMTPRGTLQRVQYRVEDETLVREYWPVMDHPLGMEPRSEVLLEEVNAVEVEYLDNENEWRAQWPPLNQLGSAALGFPKAVRINVELAGLGEIERVIEVVQ